MRDGHPGALAGLCARRGPAVLAYCERVAGEEHAVAAAAEAFRRFRAAVVAASDPTDLKPEALLISVTRHAAAAQVPAPPDTPDLLRFYARRPGSGWCGDTPALLAARADRAISTIDLARLEQHLAGCPACRAPQARFEAAERAYRSPPDTPLPLAATAMIMSALAAAAPVTDAAAAATAAANGTVAVPVDAPSYDQAEPTAADMPPATAAAAPAAAPSAPAAAAPAPPVAIPEPPPAPAATATAPAPPADVRELPLPPVPAAASERTPAPFERELGDVDAPTSEYTLPELGESSRKSEAATTPARRKIAMPSLGALPSLPSLASLRGRLPQRSPRKAAPTQSRPQLAPAATGGPSSPRRSERLRPAALLPVVLVVLAIVIALAVAGVFGGGDGPSPSNSSPAPATSSGGGREPDAIVVPGGDTSAAAIEAAKARARATARRAAERQSGSSAPPATQPSTPGGTDAAPSAIPPPP